MELENTTSLITIKCGNVEFVINRTELMKYPDSMLSKRFCNNNFMYEAYLDRDPEIFKLVLDYYRDSKLIIPFNIPLDRILSEFEFFCLEPENLKVTNINDNWKQNKSIKTIQKILDNMVMSEWFQKTMLNKFSFSWYIGNPVNGFEYYSLFFKNNIINDIVISYLKNKYNLKAEWFSQIRYKVTEYKYYHNTDNPEMVLKTYKGDNVVIGLKFSLYY